MNSVTHQSMPPTRVRTSRSTSSTRPSIGASAICIAHCALPPPTPCRDRSQCGMRTLLVAGPIAVLTFISSAAHADDFVGGSYARVRQNGGPFDGSDSGYKLFVGSFNKTVGLEAGWGNFGHLGGGDGAPPRPT